MIREWLGDQALVELIVQLIDHLDRRLSGLAWADFLGDVDEIDLSAYRLLQIGEAGNKLSEALKSRHTDFDWRAMYRMRNILTHSYASVDAMTIWETAKGELIGLSAICALEIERHDGE